MADIQAIANDLSSLTVMQVAELVKAVLLLVTYVPITGLGLVNLFYR